MNNTTMNAPPMPSHKTCASCGRRFAWRRRWSERWDEVRYCSAACRARKVRPFDRRLEAAILELLEARREGATICPSEAARRVDPSHWRTLMEPARRAARRLAARGEVDITQSGRVVDPAAFVGAIRIRRRPSRSTPVARLPQQSGIE